MIEVENLSKYYGKLAAIRNVSFRVEAGEIVGFLGPNAAGKTTTMRILTCFSPPSSGDAKILGMSVWDESIEVRQKIGYLPENVPLYDWMRVRNYLDFVARAKGVAARSRAEEVDRVASSVGLGDVMGKIIKWLSKGFRQRVGLAQALIGDPPILILDEPTIGLDPRQIREIRTLIKSFSKNRTVILSTHILPEVSQICDRVIIINKGSIVAEDTPANLTSGHGRSRRVQVTARVAENEIHPAIAEMPGVVAIHSMGMSADGQTSMVVEAAPDLDIRPALARNVLAKGWDLLELRSLDLSLEDVFIDLVTEETEDGTAAEAAEEKEAVQ